MKRHAYKKNGTSSRRMIYSAKRTLCHPRIKCIPGQTPALHHWPSRLLCRFLMLRESRLFRSTYSSRSRPNIRRATATGCTPVRPIPYARHFIAAIPAQPKCGLNFASEFLRDARSMQHGPFAVAASRRRFIVGPVVQPAHGFLHSVFCPPHALPCWQRE